MMRHISFICALGLIVGILFLTAPKEKPVYLNMDTYEEFSPSPGDEIPLIIEEDGKIKYYKERSNK